MASKTIDIAVNVRDAASRPLRQVEKQMKRTGKQAKQTGVDFTQFNRVMFSTTAFIGIFSVAMSRLSDAMMQAAQTDRIINQYEKAVGPQGELVKMIRGMTDTSIDHVEAMRAAISVKTMGIVTDTQQIAEMLARAGTAAKLAGKDSSEGIKEYTAFLKDGSVSHLENLNLLSRSNKSFKLQQAILGKYGGVMGGVISLAHRQALAQELLVRVTRNNMKGNRDYLDTLKDLGQFTTLARQEVFKLALQAFQPLLEKVVDASINVMFFVKNVRRAHPEIVFLTKVIGTATAAVGGLFAAFGTLRLATIALGAVGIGIPALVTSLVALGATFLTVTNGADSLTDRLKVFGGVFQGTFQLVKSFLTDPENFARGIGEIDTKLADLLRSHGLLDLVTQMARVTASITMFAKGVASGFRDGIDYIVDKVGGFGKALLQILGIDPGPWSRFWVEGIEGIGKAIGKLSVGILAAVAAFKMFSFAKGILKGIPIFGKMLGGGSGRDDGPKGTASDPIHVIDRGSMIEGAAKGGRGLLKLLGIDDMMRRFKHRGALFKVFQGSTTRGMGQAGAMAAAAPGAIRAGMGTAYRKAAGAVTGFSSAVGRGVQFFTKKLPSEYAMVGKVVRQLPAQTGFSRALTMLGIQFRSFRINSMFKFQSALNALGRGIRGFSLGGLISGVARGAGGLASAAAGAGGAALRAGGAALMKILPKLIAGLRTFSNIVGTVAKRFVIFSLLAGAAYGVYKHFDSIKSAGQGLYDTIRVKIQGPLIWLGEQFTAFGNFVFKTITGLVDWLSEIPLIGRAVKSMRKFFNDNKDDAADVLKNVGYTVVGGILKPIETVSDGIGYLANQADKAINPDAATIGERSAALLMNNQLPKFTADKFSPEQRLAQLQATQEKLSGEQQARFAEAMILAQDKASKDGTVITPGEYEKIMRHTLGEAMEFIRKPLERTAENTVKSEATATAQRGC